MSSASFSESSSSKATTGFSEKDVQTFLSRGGSLASRRQSQPDIGAFKPQEKTLTTTTETATAGGIAKAFGAKDTGTKTTQSGFLGEFSDISKGELDLISGAFLRRTQNIQQRRRQPGRTNLFFGRS